jgi:hypothetical protein
MIRTLPEWAQLALAEDLDMQPAHIVGHIACLWLWAVDNAPDGDVRGTSDRTLARAAGWEGDAATFVAALRSNGFLDQTRRLHDWDDYTGRLQEQRERQRDRKREQMRRYRAKHASINGEAPVVPLQEDHVVPLQEKNVVLYEGLGSSNTVPNQTVPNQTRPSTEEYSVGSCGPDADAPAASRPINPAIGSVLDAQSEEPPPRPGPLAVPKPSEHPFRDLWTAFDQIFGEARTRTERGRRAKACEETRESRYTAAEIVLAAQHWPNVMGDATMTELGIVANLGKLLHGPQVNGRSNGTVTAHTQRLTETALVPHQATVADIRRRRKGNDEPGR